MDNNVGMPVKGKLARVTILRVLLLTWVLVTGIGIGIGRRIKSENQIIYRDFAQSYARILATNVDGDRIPGYLESSITDAYYNNIHKSMKGMVDNADLRYLYVFVPVEEGIRYVWDAQSDDDSRPLNDIWYYDGNYPSDKVFEAYNNGKEVFYTYQYDVLHLAAYVTPIRNSSGDVVALAEADIIMPRAEMIFPSLVKSIIAYVLIVLVVSMALFYFFTRKRIITPLERINAATSGMIESLESDEDIAIDVHTGDEIEVVARSIEKMNHRLKEYIRENNAITAERERIGAELDVAANIQSSMLPSLFPAYPQREEFDIYATMEPAKEIGGDFYDFYMIGEDRLGIVVADVSGKGIPAALYMMIAKILLKTQMQSVPDPAATLDRVNDLLHDNNDESMFVTVWLAILDIATGELTYADAGHERIVLYQNGEWKIIPKAYRGMVLGMVSSEDIAGLPDNRRYHNQTIMLAPGDVLLEYTDGVTEATREDSEMFGEDRLLEAVKNAPSRKPEELLPHIRGSITEFVGEAEQFDDITMLVLRYNGTQESEEK